MIDGVSKPTEPVFASPRSITRRFWRAVPLWVTALHLAGREARVLIAMASNAGTNGTDGAPSDEDGADGGTGYGGPSGDVDAHDFRKRVAREIIDRLQSAGIDVVSR